MRGITPKQYETLVFIEQYIEANGIPPSRMDIARKFGITNTAAQLRVRSLVDAGKIEVHPRLARGIRLLEKSFKDFEL